MGPFRWFFFPIAMGGRAMSYTPSAPPRESAPLSVASLNSRPSYPPLVMFDEALNSISVTYLLRVYERKGKTHLIS